MGAFERVAPNHYRNPGLLAVSIERGSQVSGWDVKIFSGCCG
jgi:hypothetical protein